MTRAARALLETEQKFAFGDDRLLPDLTEVAAAAGLHVVASGPVDLVATYYDTADLRLLRSGATLRRREGGDDEGWHLKVPAGEHARTELHLPLAISGPSSGASSGSASAVDGGDGGGWFPSAPDELLELVFARLRGAEVRPVAVVRTRRAVTELRSGDGRALVTVADDVVVASPLGRDGVDDGPAGQLVERRWREIEVEEAPGAGGLARRVAQLVVGAGGRPDDHGPKLAHALGISDPAGPRVAGVPASGDRRQPAGGPSLAGSAGGGAGASASGGVGASASEGGAGAGTGGEPAAAPPRHTLRELALTVPLVAAVVGRLAEQTEALMRQDLAVRRGEPDSVHQMRVAARRLRSALATFRALFAEGPARELRAELDWLAHTLGEARDAEVIRMEIDDALRALPPEQLLGPVRATIGDRLVGREAVTLGELTALMRSERYGRLLEALSSFVDEPPLVAGEGVGPSSRKAVRSELARTAAKAARKELRGVRRRMGEARVATGPRRAAALHQARKRSKRARYALETVTPALGGKARQLAQRYEAVQELLGEHHDATVIGELLREEGARAGVRPGENGYTYGLLAGIERCRAERAEEAAWAAFERADERKARRFLR